MTETTLIVRGQRVPVDQIFVGPTYCSDCASDNGDGTITINARTVNLRDNPNHTGPSLAYNLSQTIFDPPQGASYVVASYGTGTPSFELITNVELINESDTCPIVTVYRDDNHIHILDWDGIASGLPNRLHQRFVKTMRFANENGGLKISVNTDRHILITAGRTWHGAVRMMLDALNSSVDESELWYLTGSTWAKTAITQYNNTQYNDPNTGLVTLQNNNNWTVNWVYRGVEMDVHAIVVLSNEEYDTAAEANDGLEPTIPDIVRKQFILVGRIIVKKNTTSPIVQSAFTQRFAPGAASDHENLAGLLGGLPGNHYHFANADDVAEAEVLEGAAAGAVMHVLEQNTWYRYETNPGLTRDGLAILNTADGGTTRWVAFSGRWQVFQYDDIAIDAQSLPAGAASPDLIPVPGAPNISAYGYDGNNTTESKGGTMELLHGYREGSDLWPHVHWSPTDNNTGNVRWVFEYVVFDPVANEFRAPVILTAIQAAGGLGPNGRPIQHNVEFNLAIPGVGLTIGCQIRFTIRREPGNAADTYGSDAILWAVGIHYEINSQGSLQRFVK